MIYGAITNSWRNQLDDADLADLIATAQDHGARHIELRQTCLGLAEAGEGQDWRPNLTALADVVVRFPDLTFDLAVALPCITTDIDPQGGLYQSQLEAARLVGGGSPPPAHCGSRDVRYPLGDARRRRRSGGPYRASGTGGCAPGGYLLDGKLGPAAAVDGSPGQ